MTSSERRPQRQDGVTPADFQFVRELARKHSAVALDDSKTYLVSSRLLPVARREGFASVGDLIGELRARPFGRLHVASIEALVTTETSFFRDFHPFEAIRDHVLPELIRTRRTTSRALNVWSAACSSGQEPHSLAMLIRDQWALLNGWNLQLIATDLSNSMIDRAREARYAQHEINRGLPARYLVRYFHQDRNTWQLKDEVRSMFRFQQLNLVHDWPQIPPVDLLLMRNVLIYFDVETRRQILRRVRRILRPDGYLVLGAAETTLNLDEGFGRVQLGRSVFYRLVQGGAAR